MSWPEFMVNLVDFTKYGNFIYQKQRFLRNWTGDFILSKNMYIGVFRIL